MTAPHKEPYLSRRARWLEWDAQNPHFYPLFEKYAMEALEHGVTRLSAWLIINRIRWDTRVLLKSGDHKISNDFIGHYARKFMMADPDNRVGFFEIKPMRGESFKHTMVACGHYKGPDI